MKYCMKNTLDNYSLIICVKNMTFLLQLSRFSLCQTMVLKFFIQKGKLKPQIRLKLYVFIYAFSIKYIGLKSSFLKFRNPVDFLK